MKPLACPARCAAPSPVPIETKLKEIDDPRLTSWMLMMRRDDEKDFMLRRDPKYVSGDQEVGR